MAQALATKYRPRAFDDVVGQETTLAILKSQVSSDDTKQSYLFVGSAGTGKTTIARIFADALNGGKGGAVVEIDAASNNGVENVRTLREDSQFKPMNSKRKVYIIDEVHMLSTGAFNALLKTLEEPPAHAVFILATTDPQKIPATILSRVQRFDFKRMTVRQITERLRYILEQENKTWTRCVSDAALEYIAKLADGGMRDSISLLDTCLSYKDDLEVEDVTSILGGTPYESYLKLLEALNEGHRGDVILLVDDLHLAGKDLRQFVRGLVEFIVELMKMEMQLEDEHISVPANYHEWMLSVLVMYGKKGRDFTKLFTRINEMYQRIRYEHHPKVLIQGELAALC